ERRCPGGAARRATAGEHGAAVTQHHERPDVAADRRQLALERAREPRTPRRARTRPEDAVALRSCRCTLVEHNPGVATCAADVRHLLRTAAQAHTSPVRATPGRGARGAAARVPTDASCGEALGLHEPGRPRLDPRSAGVAADDEHPGARHTEADTRVDELNTDEMRRAERRPVPA